MSAPRYPSLFQVNTRVRLSELSAALGRPATLDDVTDAELDQFARDGFDLVWFLGVWQTGEAARCVTMASRRTLARAWGCSTTASTPDSRSQAASCALSASATMRSCGLS